MRITLVDAVWSVVDQRAQPRLGLLKLFFRQLLLSDIFNGSFKVENFSIGVTNHLGVLAHKEHGLIPPFPHGLDAPGLSVTLNLGAE